MRVSVTLTIDGVKETVLEGVSSLFSDGVDYMKGFDSRLRDIGFWLENWNYAGQGGAKHKGRVFVPWTSALYILELGED